MSDNQRSTLFVRCFMFCLLPSCRFSRIDIPGTFSGRPWLWTGDMCGTYVYIRNFTAFFSWPINNTVLTNGYIWRCSGPIIQSGRSSRNGSSLESFILFVFDTGYRLSGGQPYVSRKPKVFVYSGKGKGQSNKR